MINPKFILSKSKLMEQYKKLTDLNLKISYSYKTNHEAGQQLQELTDCDFSIHTQEEIKDIKDKSRIWFFLQAESQEEITQLLRQNISNFVIDNEVDLQNLLRTITSPINLSIRMKFQEHRIGSGKYFVYGLSSKKTNKIIKEISDNPNLNSLGIHIHRKSQNTSEWNILDEIQDSLELDTLKRINFLNLGGGLPTKYKSYTSKVLPYIFEKITKTIEFLEKHNIVTFIEPGRFLAAPCIKLQTTIIQSYNNNLVVDTTIYNTALDTHLTGTKMLVEDELEEEEVGNYYLVKGNSPTRDDIFRYKVKLNNPQVGDKIIFLNAGAYNYTTDFFGYKKLETKIEN